ncbi:putative zinc finger protein [Orchesella cincta]|uniref:Putative zinc finger protein n=1 Tax=Orchesella cincta TaxID=48709 RepID=A0A1D2M0N8_ORCCI|nr:putative zinc finger protein [Orchesella cincta]
MKYHVPVSKLSCELCANEFLTLDELKIHLRSHESTDRSEICEYCGTYFLHLNSLRAHIRKFHSEGTAESVNSNNNEKVYKCKHCDFTSHLRLVITQHGKIHTEEYRFPCNTREKPFSPKLHQQIANGNRNGKNPAYCDWCKKNYVNHNYLRKHHVRCKMRPPTADREIPLTEKPKEKKKSSFVIVTASVGYNFKPGR